MLNRIYGNVSRHPGYKEQSSGALYNFSLAGQRYNVFCNKFKNSQNNDIQITCSGTLLIRSPMGPKKFGRINRVAVLSRVFLQEKWRFLPGGQKKVAVITR